MTIVEEREIQLLDKSSLLSREVHRCHTRRFNTYFKHVCLYNFGRGRESPNPRLFRTDEYPVSVNARYISYLRYQEIDPRVTGLCGKKIILFRGIPRKRERRERGRKKGESEEEKMKGKGIRKENPGKTRSFHFRGPQKA